MYRVLPDDPIIVNMDPVLKIWMFQNWLADQNDKGELAKNHAYLLGSFWNPEAVKQLMKEGNVHESTDEEFDETSKWVKEFNAQSIQMEGGRKRKRRTLKE